MAPAMLCFSTLCLTFTWLPQCSVLVLRVWLPHGYRNALFQCFVFDFHMAPAMLCFSTSCLTSTWLPQCSSTKWYLWRYVAMDIYICFIFSLIKLSCSQSYKLIQWSVDKNECILTLCVIKLPVHGICQSVKFIVRFRLQVLHSRNLLRSGTIVGTFKLDIGTVYATQGTSTAWFSQIRCIGLPSKTTKHCTRALL